MKFDYFIQLQIEDSKVRIEPLGPKHLFELEAICLKDTDLLKFSPPIDTKQKLKEYIKKAIGERMALSRYPFSIYDKGSRRYVGSTSYLSVCIKNKRLQIGETWVGKDYQRTGINRRCKFLLLKYAFENLLFERVEFIVDSRNSQAINALKAIEAVFEGEMRSHVQLLGERGNSLLYSILKEEWSSIKCKHFLKWDNEYSQKIYFS